MEKKRIKDNTKIGAGGVQEKTRLDNKRAKRRCCKIEARKEGRKKQASFKSVGQPARKRKKAVGDVESLRERKKL